MREPNVLLVLGMTRTTILRVAVLALLGALPALATTAGTDPWSTAAANLRTLFTGPVVTALSVICVIIAGITWGFGEGNSKGKLAGMIFGLGMALAAVPFLNWITPTGTTVGAATFEDAAGDSSPISLAVPPAEEGAS